MGYGGALIWTGLARNLKRQFPEKKIVLINHLSLWNVLLLRKNMDLQIYKNNPDIALVTNQFCWQLLRPWYHPKKRVVVDLGDKRYHYWIDDSPERMTYRQDGHAIAIACQPFNLPDVELKTRLVLDQKEDEEVGAILDKHDLLSKQYFCIEPNAKKTFTANKQWPLEHWQELVALLRNWLKEKNIALPIVQIGVLGSPVLEGVIDLTGSTTFRQIKKIVDNAALVVANEGGVAHLAASSDTKAVIISNPSLPLSLMTYPQHINIFPDKEPHDCGLKKPCPVCRDLLASIPPAFVFEAITTAISNGAVFSSEQRTSFR